MASERRLATLVHVSDLHIGDLSSNDDAELDSPLKNWFQFLRTFEGFFGHGGDALVQLQRIWMKLRKREDAYLIVTGDLTAAATDSQYTLARNFLCSTIRLSSGEEVGLQLADTFDRSIPGNHDHWSGKNPTILRPFVMLGHTSSELARTFPKLPVPLQRIDLGRGRTLVLAGIDSDADVKSRHDKFFARGLFCSQLDALGDQLKDLKTNPATEVRVLLVHHSRSYPNYTLGMSPESRKRLSDFVNEHQISVLLSGHVHIPYRDLREGCGGGIKWDVLEQRCGTSTIRDTLPESWPSWQLSPNTLLVHRLFDLDDGGRIRIEWRTSLLQRTDEGFVDPRRIPAVKSFFDAIWDRPVTVWPR